MTSPIVKSLIDEEIESIERRLAIIAFGLPRDELIADLPASMAVPGDRVLMVFKGISWADALHSAELASIENVHAWSRRACMCGEWTVSCEVKA
jgi:hypothetical protein